MLIALSGSSQTAPAFWLNPQNGVVYSIAVQTPQYTVDSLDSLLNIPVGAAAGAATAERGAAAAGQPGGAQQADRSRPWCRATTSQPVIDVYVSVQGTDLASVASKVQKLVDEMRPKLSRGSRVEIRGQVQTMQSSFIGLGVGLAMAIVLVYLLIVVTFQSWLDAAIIITALPAALAGIAWMLFITGTTLSVPALTGAIMTMGVATANSILLVVVRARAAAGGHSAAVGRAGSRRHPYPPGADDGAGDDHRHDPDGAGPGRRRRAERAAGPRGDRWPDLCHGVDIVFRTRRVRGGTVGVRTQAAASTASGRNAPGELKL